MKRALLLSKMILMHRLCICARTKSVWIVLESKVSSFLSFLVRQSLRTSKLSAFTHAKELLVGSEFEADSSLCGVHLRRETFDVCALKIF